MEKLLSILEVAERWKTSRQQVARVLDRGAVPFVVLAGRRLIPAAKLPHELPKGKAGRPKSLVA